ncbi:MAG TPA: beta-ketoacyl-ACP synthase II [Anaerolineae bacterium]|nr:beta-ketoacyl-ACP synthase II [Anaerolineae bacterium]HOQ99881.1 beta-ketoacyl-ACP synthase II [Anaerolineae bacterium]
MDHRVVISGMGMISPLGLSVEETWQGLLAGRSAVAPIVEFSTEGFPTRMAAQVRGFDALNYLGHKDARRAGRFTQFAAVAISEAIIQSKLDMDSEDRTRVGLQIGSAIGGLAVIEDQTMVLREKGVRRINPVFVPTVIVSAAPCQLAVLWHIQGPTHAPAAACATGIVALGEAMRNIKWGDADVVLAGGTEATITPLALAAFSRLGALSTRNDDPAHACRPFDVARDGTVIGEGAAVVVQETAEHAQRRGARILAEVLGYGFTEDGFHMTAPEPNGEGAARAMRLALREAGIAADEVDLIVPHGTGTPLNDVAETRAIHTVFGEHARRLLISSNKGSIGHTLGAAGAVSSVVGIKAILEGVVPPTANLENPDPACDLDYVPHQPRPARVNTVLVNAIGFGGQNASLILRRWQGE